MSELMKGLEINGEQLCVVAALLGNFLLPEIELADLHKKLIAGKASKVDLVASLIFHC